MSVEEWWRLSLMDGGRLDKVFNPVAGGEGDQ